MENAIKIHLPITISYSALEEAINQQMKGEYIPPQKAGGSNEPPYAQILDVRVTGTTTGVYDIIIDLKIKILRTVLKRNPVDLQVMVALAYNNESQVLGLRKYKVDAKTDSGFYNSSLEFLANKVANKQIMEKSRINLRELIAKEIKKVNGLLDGGLDLKGLQLKGAVEEVRIPNISTQPEGLLLELVLQGNLQANIFDLLSLMPPKQV